MMPDTPFSTQLLSVYIVAVRGDAILFGDVVL